MAKKKEVTKEKPVLKRRTAKQKESVVSAKKKEKEERVPILTEEMLEEIHNEIIDLKGNLDKTFRFKASAARARKNTVNLQKMFKVFRASSIDYWKNQDVHPK